jgi:hypothetical protein
MTSALAFLVVLLHLRYFVLDNSTNNNTTLVKLSKEIGFDAKEKRLRYIGHILNLIAKNTCLVRTVLHLKMNLKRQGHYSDKPLAITW